MGANALRSRCAASACMTSDTQCRKRELHEHVVKGMRARRDPESAVKIEHSKKRAGEKAKAKRKPIQSSPEGPT